MRLKLKYFQIMKNVKMGKRKFQARVCVIELLILIRGPSNAFCPLQFFCLACISKYFAELLTFKNEVSYL